MLVLRALSTLGLFLLLLTLLINCTDSDCPTCPAKDTPEPVPDTEYLVYLVPEYGGDHILVWNTRSQQVIDTMSFASLGRPLGEYDIWMMPDGRTLLCGDAGNSAFLFDLRLEQEVLALPEGEAVLSPNGQYIALQGQSVFRMLRADTFEEVLVDSVALRDGRFDQRSGHFFARLGLRTIVKYDPVSGSKLVEFDWEAFAPDWYPNALQPVDSGRTLYLRVRLANTYFSRIVRYDLETGKTTICHEVSGPYGDFSVPRDERFVYFTDPTPILIVEHYAQPFLYRVDTRTDRVSRIYTGAWQDTVNQRTKYAEPFRIMVTPDGRYCFSSGTLAGGFGAQYDLYTGETTFLHQFILNNKSFAVHPVTPPD